MSYHVQVVVGHLNQLESECTIVKSMSLTVVLITHNIGGCYWGISGMDQWNGMVEWINGMDQWNGMVEWNGN